VKVATDLGLYEVIWDDVTAVVVSALFTTCGLTGQRANAAVEAPSPIAGGNRMIDHAREPTVVKVATARCSEPRCRWAPPSRKSVRPVSDFPIPAPKGANRCVSR